MAVKAVHASTSAPELPFGGRSTTVGGLMPLGRARCGDPALPRTLRKMSRLLVPSLVKFPAFANFCGRALFAKSALMSSRNTSDPNHRRDRAVQMRALALTIKDPETVTLMTDLADVTTSSPTEPRSQS